MRRYIMNILKEKIICDITEGITEDLSERINEYKSNDIFI